MKKFSALPFVIALALIICTLGSRTESADNPLRELQGRKDQLKAWETYRDEAQKELDRKSAELESARAAADVGAREKEIEKREQAIDKDAPKALKEAFKSDVTGKMSFAALWGTIKIALNTFKLSSAINESIAIQADID